jgi:hypothetical protein
MDSSAVGKLLYYHKGADEYQPMEIIADEW